MAESTSDSNAEVVKATPPPASDVANNGVDSDAVGVFLFLLCYFMLFLCVITGWV